MRNKVYSMAAFLLYSANLILAQDPPPLPDAPTQGPINGLVFSSYRRCGDCCKKIFWK